MAHTRRSCRIMLFSGRAAGFERQRIAPGFHSAALLNAASRGGDAESVWRSWQLADGHSTLLWSTGRLVHQEIACARVVCQVAPLTAGDAAVEDESLLVQL